MKQQLFKGITNRPICAEFIMINVFSHCIGHRKFRVLVSQDQIDIH